MILASIMENPSTMDEATIPYLKFIEGDNVEYDEENLIFRAKSYGFLFVERGVKINVIAPVLSNKLKTKAYVYLFPLPDNSIPTIEDIRTVAYNQGITQLLSNEDILRQISNVDWNKVKESKKPKKILFAQGLEPQDGWKKYYILKINPDLISGKIGEDGRIDFRERDYIKEVKRETVIFEEVPGQEMRNGLDIFGKMIKARMIKHKEYKIGKNIKRSDKNPLIHVASIDGRVSYHAPTVDINDSVFIPTDVDYSTGNVSFDGTIEIRGSVLSGFKVIGGSDIFISENIEESTVEAKGNLILHGGINGGDKANVHVEGNLQAKYIQHATVFVEGSIIIQDSIINSEVMARGYVEVGASKSGKIVGGSVIGKMGVKASVIGSASGSDTFIGARMDPDIFEKFAFHKKMLKELQEQKKTITDMIFHSFGADFLKNPKKYLVQLPTPRKRQVVQLLNELQEINRKITINDQAAEDLKEILHTPDEVKIEILSEIYPPAKIQLKGEIVSIEKKIGKVRYYIPAGKSEITTFYI